VYTGVINNTVFRNTLTTIVDKLYTGIYSGDGYQEDGNPDNALAVGPSFIVSAENASIEWTDLSGGSKVEQSATTFFQPLGNIPTNYLAAYDPRVAYDSVDGKFIISEGSLSDNQPGGNAPDAAFAPGAGSLPFLHFPLPNFVPPSSVLVAISKDANPNDGWNFYRIDTTIPTSSGELTWADYPRLAFDSSHVYVATNQYGFANQPPAFMPELSVLNTSSGVVSHYTLGLDTNAPSLLGTVFPVAVPGSGLVLIGHDQPNELEVQRFDPTTNSLTSPYTISLADITSKLGLPSSVPQAGSNVQVEAGDWRIEDLKYANGKIYGVFDLSPSSGPDAGAAVAHWFVLNATNPDHLTLLAEGNISGAQIAPGESTFYPSIAVDGNGDALVNFIASGPSMMPTDYYAFASHFDPLSFGAPHAYQASTSPASATREIGDYSTAVADPNNPAGFWISHEFIQNGGAWATAIAHVEVTKAWTLLA
jgi:hypothetical protein